MISFISNSNSKLQATLTDTLTSTNFFVGQSKANLWLWNSFTVISHTKVTQTHKNVSIPAHWNSPSCGETMGTLPTRLHQTLLEKSVRGSPCPGKDSVPGVRSHAQCLARCVALGSPEGSSETWDEYEYKTTRTMIHIVCVCVCLFCSLRNTGHSFFVVKPCTYYNIHKEVWVFLQMYFIAWPGPWYHGGDNGGHLNSSFCLGSFLMMFSL